MEESTQSLKFVGADVTNTDIAQACLRQAVTHVELHNCDRVTDVSALADIPTLVEARIYSCKRVRCFGLLCQKESSLRKLVLFRTPITGAQLKDLRSHGIEVVLKESTGFEKMVRPSESLVKSSLDLIRKVTADVKPEQIGIAFNGGKDSVVMMDLLLCVFGSEVMKKFCIFVLGIGGMEEFNEMVSFRENYASTNGFVLTKTDSSLSMKEGLEYLKETRDIQLVFMGTRKSDSAHQKESVERTTKGWPDMLRVCLLFNWSYEDIWGYILAYGIPFCSLYAEGYTSLGSLNSTAPNPLLRRSDGTFSPAWELSDSSAERNGRHVKA
ncbi:phosphoadenosine phosphosulfate reductase-like protein [Trypanosoma theileri]|uniref:FAD synthase n=1 Tax=Trypanosoma theileri TaxID=67003 RepID=A0A1X0NVD4_9TRYP|nr:phosphoadenosine phosphosulfate reductase-like protein [Trypanosoma theileri]ORC88657.1 phosphoadenosine phosphosulfate reductase-like protein [Trypanosoma theileri]